MEVQALLREHTTTHQVNELHYLKKLPADPSAESVPMIVFLNGAGERGPADGSELVIRMRPDLENVMRRKNPFGMETTFKF